MDIVFNSEIFIFIIYHNVIVCCCCDCYRKMQAATDTVSTMRVICVNVSWS